MHLDNAIIPDDNSQWIPLERNTLIFNVLFDVWKGIYKVEVQLCSPQARYPHTIQYAFEVLEQKTLQQSFADLIEKGL